jgi:hypothetical protein
LFNIGGKSSLSLSVGDEKHTWNKMLKYDYIRHCIHSNNLKLSRLSSEAFIGVSIAAFISSISVNFLYNGIEIAAVELLNLAATFLPSSCIKDFYH